MMLSGFLFLLLMTDGESSERNCTYQDVLNHLNFTKNKELFSMIRPVKNYKQPTDVYVTVLPYAILDVNEKDQKFVPYVWTWMVWQNEFISWNPQDLCGIEKFTLPTDVLWKPDLTIEEMTERDKAPPSPYLTVYSNGHIQVENDQVLVSACRMRVHKFPFDIQRCNLSIKSVIHSEKEMQLFETFNSSTSTKWSQELMRIQYEWLFIGMTVCNETVDNFGFIQKRVVYTITIKRRSILYIINFLLPVLFFLCLDLASFLISDSGGEKLGFKITVLLAVTVMQLILNEILPTSSDRVPLIALYCTGIFGLMMLSLVETIVVMNLRGRDSASQDNEADKDQSLSEDCGDKRGKVSFQNCFRDICDVSPGETPSEPLPMAKEGSSIQLMEESQDSEKLLKTLVVLLSSRKEEEKPGYWTRKTKTINKVFFIFYVIAATLFLVFMFFSWNSEDQY
ncbi:5-hydroxytryptamine receptor 3A-like isoform X2 [Dicentrarchus labrax]|uniref:5-hydroxytryptamine receptor 3A-like isoform X2 n=1 Tax=Dicentrarchus labrax TaxID=13489 RepID=UPI0021F51D8E|nr:5-hydroxytryptamine receptor 3A-like isoform X2 [Dicentrarchus labrax]